MGFIYKITCLITNKVYIGQTTCKKVQERWTQHLNSARLFREYRNDPEFKRKVAKSHLYRAMFAYGVDNFHFEIIEILPKLLLNPREKYWIEYYDSIKNGYNIMPGGNNYPKCKRGFGKKGNFKRERKGKLNVKRDKRKHTHMFIPQTDKEGRKLIREGLPDHCKYTFDKSKGKSVFKIKNHPLCPNRQFLIDNYESFEAAKQAVIDFIEGLKAKNEKYKPAEKAWAKLPEGIIKVDLGFKVQKKHSNGKYIKNCRKRYKTEEENFNDALTYLNECLRKLGQPEVNITYQEII